MKASHDYQIGDQVLFPAIDNCPFLVVGVRMDSLEIQGDFSGGTHNVSQTDWVSISELEHYQPPISKYAVGLRVWYHANLVRIEGDISEVVYRPHGIFYKVGTDLVPQEQLLPV